ADWKRCVHRIRVYTFANSVRLWLLDVVDHQRVHDCLLRDKLQSELVLDDGLVVLFRRGPQGKKIGSRETRLIEDRPVNSDHSADGVRPVAVHPVHKGRHVCDGCIVRAAGELALQRRAGCIRITSLLPLAEPGAGFSYGQSVNRHLLLRVTQYEVKPLVEKRPKHSSQLTFGGRRICRSGLQLEHVSVYPGRSAGDAIVVDAIGLQDDPSNSNAGPRGRDTSGRILEMTAIRRRQSTT